MPEPDSKMMRIHNVSVLQRQSGRLKEAGLNRIDVPEDYEVLDATTLGKRLGFKRDTVLAYLSRRNFGRIPCPNRLLAMGAIWYEKSVRKWEAR
jgi:predicted protein tyrosine phosphatase